MPRGPRIDIPGLLYHVIVRGIERRDIFSDDDDRHHFLNRLSSLLVDTDTNCLAWALMPNHFHLLLRPRMAPLSTFMRRLLTGYAVTFNLRHDRSGHLFQNRYKSVVCEEEEYLLELVRYIHLNPLRAGLVRSMDDLDGYQWSGHRIMMSGNDLPGQPTDEILRRFGKSLGVARRHYRTFVEDGMAADSRREITARGVKSAAPGGIAAAPIDSRVLGNETFIEQFLVREESPRRRKVSLEKIIDAVTERLGLSMGELMTPSRAQKIADARSIICQLGYRDGHSGVVIARHLELTPAGVSVAARRGAILLEKHPQGAELVNVLRASP